jgi:HK97 family phage portal protein
VSWASRLLGLRAAAPVAHEMRSAPGATIAPGYTSPDQPLWQSWNAEAAIRNAYERNIYAYRAINRVAESIAGLPFLAGHPPAAAPGSPLARLLSPPPLGPNLRMSAAALWRYSIAQYLTIGKFAWLVGRDTSGRIESLWPMQAQHLLPVPNTNPANDAYWTRFEYGNRGTGNYREYRPDQLVYIWRPSLADFRQPEGPLQSAGVNVNILKLLEQYDHSFLRNGGVPAQLIITSPWASPDERRGFQQQFVSSFSGAANAGKVAFAEREIDPGETGQAADSVEIKQIGISQRDAQMRDLRADKVNDICVAIGTPLSMLGDSRNSKFTNMAQDRQNFWENARSLMRELEDGVNIHLAPQLGRELGWFDTSGVPELQPLPVLPTGTDAATLITAEAFTVNEWRAERGLPPLAQPLLPPPTRVGPVDPPVVDEPAVASAFRTAVAAQRDAMLGQLHGRRGRRGRRMYDRGYWSARMTVDLRDHSLPASFSQDITDDVFMQFSMTPPVDDGAVNTVFDQVLRAGIERLARPVDFPPVTLSLTDLEAALVRVAAGETIDDVLKEL